MKTIEVNVYDTINKKQAISLEAGLLLREKLINLSKQIKDDEPTIIRFDFEHIHLFTSRFFGSSLGWCRSDAKLKNICIETKNVNKLGKHLLEKVIKIADEKVKNLNYIEDIVEKVIKDTEVIEEVK